MSWLSDLITGTTSGAISGTLNGVGDAAIKIREAITGDITPEAKALLQTHLADLDTQLALAQTKINEVEAGSSTFFVSGWRPYCGWVCGLGLTYAVIGWPLLTWISSNLHWAPPPMIDVSMLIALLGSLLGLAGMRTAEKFNNVAGNH